jgi:flagellar protein FliS
LILLLYEGSLRHLLAARKAIQDGDVRQRAEHLSRAVSIVAALHDCLDSTVTDDAIVFLRGLYRAMLLELSKVSMSQDVSVLEQASRYLQYLKDIWERQVMEVGSEGKGAERHDRPSAPSETPGYSPSQSRRGYTVSV